MNKLMTLTAAALAATTAAAADIYVSLETGKNKNEGTKEAPLKNLWKALENAKDGDTIHLAEGIYPGKMKQNWFLIDKAVSILGGYSKDFSERKPLEPHAGVKALGLALRLVIGVREALVEDEAVELHVDSLGLFLLLCEVDREDAKPSALLVVVLVEGLEHRPVLKGISRREVL